MSQASSNFEWFGFHKLLRRVVFKGVLVNVEPLRIGAGKVAAAFEPVDAVVVKIKEASGKEYPYIPGPSLKGAFRSYVVKLMRSADLNVCDGVPKSSCLRGDEFKDLETKAITPRIVIDTIASGVIKICLACLIFGSPGISSHARFYDAYPNDGTWRLGYRTMITIDRKTGTALPGALYSVEYVEPGAEFNFRIEFINLPNYAIGAIAEALLDLDVGLLKIGGMKSRGFGGMSIKSLEIQAYDYISKTRLENVIPKLDPIDLNVSIDADWRKTLLNFVNVWRSSINNLKKISNAGWDWRVCQM